MDTQNWVFVIAAFALSPREGQASIFQHVKIATPNFNFNIWASNSKCPSPRQTLLHSRISHIQVKGIVNWILNMGQSYSKAWLWLSSHIQSRRFWICLCIVKVIFRFQAASRGWVGQPIIWLVLNAIEDLNYDLAVGPWHSLKTNQFSGTLGLLPWQPPEDGLADPLSGG